MYGHDWYAGMRIVAVADFKAIQDATPIVDPNVEVRFDLCDWPEQNRVYTIRAVKPFAEFIAVHLVEIINPTLPMSNGTVGETMFLAVDFKPVDESRLSEFRKLLSPLPALV